MNKKSKSQSQHRREKSQSAAELKVFEFPADGLRVKAKDLAEAESIRNMMIASAPKTKDCSSCDS